MTEQKTYTDLEILKAYADNECTYNYGPFYHGACPEVHCDENGEECEGRPCDPKCPSRWAGDLIELVDELIKDRNAVIARGIRDEWLSE